MKVDHETFGPVVDVPSREIRPAGFDCPSCHKPVRKLRTASHDGDYLSVYVCRCANAAAWEQENAPRTAAQWLTIVRLARKTKADFITISPEGGAIIDGPRNN
jgi:hypothetical protein